MEVQGEALARGRVRSDRLKDLPCGAHRKQVLSFPRKERGACDLFDIGFREAAVIEQALSALDDLTDP